MVVLVLSTVSKLKNGMQNANKLDFL